MQPYRLICSIALGLSLFAPVRAQAQEDTRGVLLAARSAPPW